MRRWWKRNAAAAAAFVLAVLTWVPAPSGAERAGEPGVAVGPITITVDDMERALAFYTGVLPFEAISDHRSSDPALAKLTGAAGPRRIVRLRLGTEILELVDYLTPGGRPIPADSRSHDRWFQHVAIIVSDMDEAYRRLAARGVEQVSPSPQRLPDWNPNAGGIRAFYFRDLDGHVLEILWFPPGTGAERWQQRDDRLFLGIDHTAIVVADTARSLAFYRDRLGLTVAGESENHGVEQERLNNVPGAHLRITALRGDAGPGIEFLEYLSPRDGRAFPVGTRASDLVHWETSVLTRDLGRLARRLRVDNVLFVSPAPVHLPGALGALVRDPDGHAVRLLEKTS